MILEFIPRLGLHVTVRFVTYLTHKALLGLTAFNVQCV